MYKAKPDHFDLPKTKPIENLNPSEENPENITIELEDSSLTATARLILEKTLKTVDK
mgnify:CR=1 FL=1